MPWEFIVTTLDGTALGTLDRGAYDRTLRIPLNAGRTCSYRVDVDHQLADALLDAPAVLTKVYDESKTLRFCGPIVSAEEATSQPGGASIAVTAADASWRLGKRLLGKIDPGFSMGTALAQVPLGSIGKAIVDAANADGDTGLQVGSYATTAQGYVAGWIFKPAGEGINEIAGTLDGFDWRVLPLEPSTGKIGEIQFADYIGQPQPNAIFEYGTGKRNVSSYRRVVNGDAIANSVYALPPTGTEGASLQGAIDAASINRYGLFEDVADNDLIADAMRLQLAQEHVAVRRNGRQTIEFQPTALGGPVEGLDYDVGDVVTFRAKVGGKSRVNATFRVFALEYNIDKEGLASRVVTLSAGS